MEDINRRIDTLDYLRGFALLGIILVNVIGIRFISVEPANIGIEGLYASFLSIFVESKFFAIFSTLFGIGFYIFMERAKLKAQNKYVLYLRRLLVLFVFGILHALLQPGEALTIYAVVGLLLLIFIHLKKEINLLIGMGLLIAVIGLDAKVLFVIPYFILGLTIAQYGLIYKLNTNLKKWKIAWMISLILTIVSLVLLIVFFAHPNYVIAEHAGIYEEYVQKRILFDHVITMTSPFIASFYILTIILLVQNEFGRKVLAPLKYYGRMALTNYICQTLFILGFVKLIFNGNITMLNSLFMCLVIYGIQIIFSMLWLKHFKYGPLEYIWRTATYLKVMPLKR
ncbi:DUF418 domain-containing protein [Staphylococcus ratti]|uniref:DUF418 domain-containing protein n=1 Tax=Staphylococcus ratti TaxID=2892440 RepID=A0ABY3PF06_9STAP|nr:DUF418 domain-containing protein [Staphylococcus ratti]UEX90882.1 DUF418 domain-containing protein [Staphylococcus ratti]